jgi:hypothetical protein
MWRYIIAGVIGAIIGFFIAALMVAARRND